VIGSFVTSKKVKWCEWYRLIWATLYMRCLWLSCCG